MNTKEMEQKNKIGGERVIKHRNPNVPKLNWAESVLAKEEMDYDIGVSFHRKTESEPVQKSAWINAMMKDEIGYDSLFGIWSQI